MQILMSTLPKTYNLSIIAFASICLFSCASISPVRNSVGGESLEKVRVIISEVENSCVGLLFSNISNDDLYLVKWEIGMFDDGLANDVFRITNTFGRRARFTKPLFKRSEPTQDDAVLIEAGGNISVVSCPREFYNISKGIKSVIYRRLISINKIGENNTLQLIELAEVNSNTIQIKFP